MKNTIVIRDSNDNRHEFKTAIKTEKGLKTFLNKFRKENNIDIAIGFITNGEKLIGFEIDKTEIKINQ